MAKKVLKEDLNQVLHLEKSSFFDTWYYEFLMSFQSRPKGP